MEYQLNHTTETSYIITKYFLKDLRAGGHVQTEIQSVWRGMKMRKNSSTLFTTGKKTQKNIFLKEHQQEFSRLISLCDPYKLAQIFPTQVVTEGFAVVSTS